MREDQKFNSRLHIEYAWHEVIAIFAYTGKLATSGLQLHQSTLSLATLNTQETEEDSLSLSSRATLMSRSRVSANSTLPAQISMSHLPSVNRCHTKTNSNGESVKVVERLRTACTGSAMPNTDHDPTGSEYKALEPSTQEPEMYDTLDPTTKDIVIRDGQVYRSLVSRTRNGASAEYTRTKSTNTQPRNQAQKRGLQTEESLTDSTSSYMYTVPGHISSPRNYQGIQPERKDYLALYMTPYTQWREMDVGGHMYQLPNPSSMESLNIYTAPDSREGSVDC